MKKSYFPIIGLSPMDGFTTMPLRSIMWKHSQYLNTTFTEFVNVEGLFRSPETHLPLLYTSKNEKRVIAQIFGNTNQLEYFKLAAALIKFLGFDGIDLNLGCPHKNIVKNESGSFLINHQDAVKSITLAIDTGIASVSKYTRHAPFARFITNYVLPYFKKHSTKLGWFKNKPKTTFTLSVKTRLGQQKIADEKWWKFLDSLNLDFITIHGRTAKQMYTGESDWNAIKQIAVNMKTPVLGNGDIKTEYDLKSKLQITPNGVLIGRGFIGNPNLKKEKKLQEQLILFKEFVVESIKIFPGLKKYINPLKKFVPYFFKNIQNAKELKQRLLMAKDYFSMLKILDQYIKQSQ